MNNFEEKKVEFFKKLKSEPDVLKSIIESNNKTENGQKTNEIILTPKNERELEIGEICYTMSKDLIKLIDDVTYGEIKSIPLDENIGLKTLISLINAVKNDEKDFKLVDEITPQYLAKILYGITVGMIDDMEEAINYIASESGFDLNDEIEAAQFKIYINQFKKFSDSLNVTNKNFENCTDKDISDAKEFVEEFHKLCVEGKKDLENESNSEKLARLLTKTLFKAFEDLNK